jgi:hypothetical protein
VVEIHQAGEFLFQQVRDKLRDVSIKALAISVGLMCFPEGLEELQPLVGVRCCLDCSHPPLHLTLISCASGKLIGPVLNMLFLQLL